MEEESADARRSASDLENQRCLEDTTGKSTLLPNLAAQDSPTAAEMPLQSHDASGVILAGDDPPRSDENTQMKPNDSIDTTLPALQDPMVQQIPRTEKSSLPPGTNDNFIPEATPPADLDDNSRVTSTSTLASSACSFVNSQRNVTSAPHSPQSQPGSIEGTPPPTSNSATFTGKPPRPTSVPIVTSHSSSTRRRRDGPEYPRYPDQSFAALQSQQYPPSYQPHPLRTRSSHASQNSSFSSIPSRSSRDHIKTVTGAKTVGSTPAQSPGLFSPVYPASRSYADESEDSQTSTPLLHPAHMQTPKE